ncbi:TPM domain-containing protein [Antarcticibacterium arcticum]|uniref:TPM domain-containing protein n=1 Tax=Antarcticibacterium arcticum TaxID=2585771 RepID=A0A5B8YP07_9FLAO|nr:TPM domain-containing protein [Antarcticibacterium arcticum]QED37579.1 TPM domain-containing protein [Antarcticibacterium arcticum]
MSKVEDFLSAKEEGEVIEAIRLAESETSGEIRVHLEKSHGDKDIFERSMEVFHLLKMDNTKLSNGVLIYVAVEDRDFVIYGDKGINDVVPTDFWESTKDIIVARFKEGNYKQGLIEGILKAGEQLKAHFPWSENINELPNTISRGNATKE